MVDVRAAAIVLLLAWAWGLPRHASSASASAACVCGNLTVPFPFSLQGNGSGCGNGSSASPGLPGFAIRCDAAGGPLLDTRSGPFRVLALDQAWVQLGNARLVAPSICAGPGQNGSARLDLGPASSPFAVAAGNRFATRGCGAVGTFVTDREAASTSCSVPKCGLSAGEEICTVPFPGGVRVALMRDSIPGHGAGECSYNSTLAYSPDAEGSELEDGFRVEFAVRGGGNCSEAAGRAGFACAQSAVCLDGVWVDGYTCACKDGFVGDGYDAGSGCQEQDLCSEPGFNQCASNAGCRMESGVATCFCAAGFTGDGQRDGEGCTDRSACVFCSTFSNCTNSGGGAYRCVCDTGYEGDGTVNGTRCYPKSSPSSGLVAGLVAGGASAAVVIVLGCCCFAGRTVVVSRQERPLRRELKKLEELIQGCSGPQAAIIFPYKVIELATKRFSESQRLGGGAFGTVYAGKLTQGTRIAVKRVNQSNAHCLQQFRNEVECLAKVNHTGLVRLLGCCLEIRDPLVVYEFVANGTLRQHLQQERGKILTWGTRMKIAVEVSQALAYLHSVLTPPIFHRDVKSSNILLDSSFAAKLADFGLSRLVPLGATHVSTMAQGTPGYLDPDYYRTYHLTDKSDVYSFGVVLMELVTARKAIDLNHEQREVPLASLAIQRLSSGELDQMIDPALQPTMTPESMHMIQQVAELAFRCLAFTRQDRPSMNEVADALETIRLSSCLNQGSFASQPVPFHDRRGDLKQSLGHLLFTNNSVRR